MKEKILCTLVDEDETGLKSLQSDLEELNLKIERVFYDSEEFLIELHKLHSQVIFLDVDMPGLDGFECAKRLGDRKIIFVSARIDRGFEAFEFNQVVDFVPKPFKKIRLKQAVSKLLEELSHDSGIVYFKFDQDEHRIHRNRIVAIRSLKSTGNKELILANPAESILVSDEPFEKILKKIDHPDFIQVGKGDVINVSFIRKRIGVDEVEMASIYPIEGNNQKALKITIGDSFRSVFDSRF